MTTSIGQNIKRARRQRNLNQAELSKLCGWSGFPSRISNYERGLREPKSEDLMKLAQTLNVNVEWFYREYAQQQHKALEVREPTPSYNAIRYVPLLHWDQVMPYLQGQHIEAKDTIPAINTESNRSFALVVEGDAMEAPHGDSFARGGIIVVDPGLQVRNGDYVIALFENHPTFKQWTNDSGKRFLKPLNPRYPIVEAPKEPTDILGVVRSFTKTFR